MTIHHPALGAVPAQLTCVVPGPGDAFTIHCTLNGGLFTRGPAQLVVTAQEAQQLAAGLAAPKR